MPARTESQDTTEAAVCSPRCLMIQKFHEQSPFVVGVTALTQKGTVSGSGTIIRTERGYFILTNNHVVQGGLKVYITPYNLPPYLGHYEVSIQGRDPHIDVALLTLPQQRDQASFPSVQFGDTPMLGQEVFVLGYPSGIRSIASGNVNSREAPHWFFVLTQLSLNPGVSGGPAFNTRHEMVGMATGTVQGTQLMGLLLPVALIQRAIPRLLEERVVKHGGTEFTFTDSWRPYPSFFDAHGLDYPPRDHGVIVVGVNSNSRAALAGVSIGDYIVSFQGEQVWNGRSLDEKIFFDYRPGDEVAFVFKRRGETLQVRYRLSEVQTGEIRPHK